MRLSHTVLSQMPSCLMLQTCKSTEPGKAVLVEGPGRGSWRNSRSALRLERPGGPRAWLPEGGMASQPAEPASCLHLPLSP